MTLIEWERILADIVPEAKVAVPALIEVLKDEDEYDVRLCAAQAMADSRGLALKLCSF